MLVILTCLVDLFSLCHTERSEVSIKNGKWITENKVLQRNLWIFRLFAKGSK